MQQYILISTVAFYPVRTAGEFKAHITFVNMFQFLFIRGFMELTVSCQQSVDCCCTVQGALPSFLFGINTEICCDSLICFTLRRMINKTKQDRVRNDRIRELCEIQNITSWVQRRRTEWSEHISTMADDRLVKKVHDGTPVGKRNRGRPLKRWRDAMD